MLLWMLRVVNGVDQVASFVKARLGGESGQGMVEYGLIIALVAVALIVTLGYLTGGLKTTFCSIVTSLGATCS